MIENTARIIFNSKFKVRVPSLSLSIINDDDRGLIVPNNTLNPNKKIDPVEVAKMDYITIYITISNMVEIYRKGFPIIAPDKNTAIAIYDAIERHLHNWKVHLETSINKKKPPIEDLLIMDDMADEIFSRYKDYVVKNTDSNAFKKPINKTAFTRLLKQQEEIEMDKVKRIDKKDIFLENYTISDINLIKGEKGK